MGGTEVTGQAVELASKISQQFQQDENNDGLLGLAFSKINTGEWSSLASPYWRILIAEQFSPRSKRPSSTPPLIRASSRRISSPSTSRRARRALMTLASLMTASTPARSTTPISTARRASGNSVGLSNNPPWPPAALTVQPAGTGYGVGNGSFQQQSIDAIADTGTTLILIEDDIVEAYYKEVSGAEYDSQQGGYTFSCDAELPDFFLGIGDYQAKVPGSFINLAPVDNSGQSKRSPWRFAWTIPVDAFAACFGGIQSSQGIGQSESSCSRRTEIEVLTGSRYLWRCLLEGHLRRL